ARGAPAERRARLPAATTPPLTPLTRLSLPPMLERGHGRILNVASVTGFLPGPLMSVYFATKHYVLAFSEALIEELRGTGVTVTALCPPPVKTSFSDGSQAAPSSITAKATILPVEVARFGHAAMKRGQAIAVYSPLYKFLTGFLVRITPRFALRRLMRRLNT